MRMAMAADDVAAKEKILDLRGAEEARLTDPVRGDEEVAAPAARFQQTGDGAGEAHAAIIEGQEDFGHDGVLGRADGSDRAFGHGGADGFQMPFEILAAE